MTKREKEEEILAKFLHLYDKSISPILPEECKLVFPTYNSENPDFIIKNKDMIIGFELVELIPNQQRFVLLDKEDKVIRNNAHLRKKKSDTSMLFEVPDLVPVVLEKINEKIDKSKNYVTTENWLLAYSTYPNSLLMLRSAIDDNIIDTCINSIYAQIDNWRSFSKVFIYEDSGTSYIIEMDIPNKIYNLNSY